MSSYLIPFIATGIAGNANVSNTANFANYAGNVTVSSQPNITSLGNLTSLNVDGNSNLGSISNVHISGGNNGYVLQTDGNSNLSWVAQSGNGNGGGNTNLIGWASIANANIPAIFLGTYILNTGNTNIIISSGSYSNGLINCNSNITTIEPKTITGLTIGAYTNGFWSSNNLSKISIIDNTMYGVYIPGANGLPAFSTDYGNTWSAPTQANMTNILFNEGASTEILQTGNIFSMIMPYQNFANNLQVDGLGAYYGNKANIITASTWQNVSIEISNISYNSNIGSTRRVSETDYSCDGNIILNLITIEDFTPNVTGTLESCDTFIIKSTGNNFSNLGSISNIANSHVGRSIQYITGNKWLMIANPETRVNSNISPANNYAVVCTSTDQGNTWSFANNLVTPNIGNVTVIFNYDLIKLANNSIVGVFGASNIANAANVTSDNLVFYTSISTDEGNSWTVQNANLLNVYSNFRFFSSGFNTNINNNFILGSTQTISNVRSTELKYSQDGGQTFNNLTLTGNTTEFVINSFGCYIPQTNRIMFNAGSGGNNSNRSLFGSTQLTSISITNGSNSIQYPYANSGTFQLLGAIPTLANTGLMVKTGNV